MALLTFLAAAVRGSEPAGSPAKWSFDITPARTGAPLRAVSPAYISFALDNAFVRTDCRPADPTSGKAGNATCLPDDATNSTRIDFSDPLLRKVMPMAKGGYIRIGGTYTDFVHYEVPGTNYTRCPLQNITTAGAQCPSNSFPCCLPLSMARWKEALEFAHDVGMTVTFNLNVLHGRWDDYTNVIRCQTHQPDCIPPAPLGPHQVYRERPAWDPSNARALMEYTASLPRELWPARFGLGNELQWYLSPAQWATDMVTMNELIKDVFGAAAAGGDTDAARPLTYGPCNCGLLEEWSVDFLGNISARDPTALGAFSYHGYQHGGPVASTIAAFPNVDASRTFFQAVYEQDWKNGTAAPSKRTELWITETAWTAESPKNAPAGGPQAALDGMCTAADMAWNLDALGAAAENGVDVFCRETLAGDWLEVLGLWQPRDQRPYTPHPDFVVAALWRKLMGVSVLGAVAAGPAPPRPSSAQDGWAVFPGFSSAFEKCPIGGNVQFPFLGAVDDVAGCEARCAALTGCMSFSWASADVAAAAWRRRCYGQTSSAFGLDPVEGVTSGCRRSNPLCKPPPPLPPLTVRPYAHCSLTTPGAVVFAITAAPCVRSRTQVTLRFPGAKSLTSYWLSAFAVADNVVALNGKNLTFAVDRPLPGLDGTASSGDEVVLPNEGLCTVGFVEVKYASVVPACA